MLQSPRQLAYAMCLDPWGTNSLIKGPR